jgi:trans-aconitate methyltransferase
MTHNVTFLPEWDGKGYAANTGHHRVHDAAFLETLPLTRTDRVLDLCCGSGDFTRMIGDLVSEGHVLGLDAQPSMIEEACTRAGANQSFVTGPVQHLATLVPDDAALDVVMSRSALHWVPEADHPALLAECFRVLRPGGVLRLEMGGGDNVRAMRSLLDGVSSRLGGPTTPWTFLGAGYYLELVEGAGFSVEHGWVRTVAQHRSFDRAAVIGWLESQCFQAYEATMPAEAHREFRAEVLDRLDEMGRPDGSFDQMFVRLDVLAHRPTETPAQRPMSQQ